jgi:hypothetical protein
MAGVEQIRPREVAAPPPRPADFSQNRPMAEEPTSIQQGLAAGKEYASRTGGDHAKLRPLVRSRNAEETRAAIDWNVFELIDEEQPVAFWSGFVHGVREFLVDEAAAQPEQIARSSPGDVHPAPRG